MNMTWTLTILLLLNLAGRAQAQPRTASQLSPVERTLDVGGEVSLGTSGTEFSNQLAPAAEHNAAEHNTAVYNAAVGLYRDGDYVAAANGFVRVASDDDPTLAAKARFNLGNCCYAQALQHLEAGDEPAMAASQLQSAIMHYRSVLRLDPNDEDARVNLELAARILDQLKPPEEPEEPEAADQPPPADQSQDDQSQDDQSQDDQAQDDQSQDDQAQDDQKEENQQPQPDDSAPEQEREPATNEDSAEDSAAPSPSSEGEKEDENGSDSPSDESPSAGESSAESTSNDASSTDHQDAAEAADQQTDNQHSDADGTEPEPPLPTERTPQGKLEAADDPADDQASEVGDPSAVNVTDAGQMMTQQEAMKMLQSIRDRDMLRRYRREAAKRSRYIPVERDW